MMSVMTDQILVTDTDHRRLRAAIRALRHHRRCGAYLNALERELRRAKVVRWWEIPEDTVTMNSRVRIHDLDEDERFICNIVYPEQAGYQEDDVSVLSPLGTAILGSRVGDVVRCPTPWGTREVKIEKLFYQPEAAGDLHL